MQTIPLTNSPAPSAPFAGMPMWGEAKVMRPFRQARTRDQQFIAMLEAYRNTGGIARADEISHRFRRCNGPDPETVRHWIDSRKVLCFEWSDTCWMPWFQFNRHTLHPHPQLAPLLAELAAVFDPWETASWFAQPNPWIAGQPPIDRLLQDLPGVLDAARADRFVANG